jgi:endoribonuclease Dicer
MVGYVQSRGRARNKASKFVVMVRNDHSEDLAKYMSFMESEPRLKTEYQSRDDLALAMDDEEDDAIPADNSERERYVVPSTGAVLTYDASINLLHYLCSLMDCSDPFTPSVSPKYSGDFTSSLLLPTTLPLPRSHLSYTGPPKRSKQEAKRAVAFMAVKKLHELNVFDDYLLPASGSKGRGNEDGDGKIIGDVSAIPEIMDVLVNDPWVAERDGKLWMHVVSLDSKRTAGLVTGTDLPRVELTWAGIRISTERGQELSPDAYTQGEARQRDLMDKFTKLGIGFCNTGKQITAPLSCFLVPLDNTGQHPDFEAMDNLVDNHVGNTDWTRITEDDCGQLLFMNTYEQGHPLVLHRIRQDLSPLSIPPPGSREYNSEYGTYHSYYMNKYKRRNGRGWEPNISSKGPLLEAWEIPRRADGNYELKVPLSSSTRSATETVLVPQSCCRWINLSKYVFHTFHILPQLCHRITDIYRVRKARIDLSLPPIADDFLVEALTLPTAIAGWNNQRLETLGDSVLKLSVTVHLFNKYPYRHEGQLDVMRQNSVCNRTLLARAKELGLERFLTCEVQSLSTWRYIASGAASRYAFRQFPRRSLQDCMEATLGAAFLSGGIPMALRAGKTLGLSMGGAAPWPLRYSRNPEPSPAPPLFAELQESLGYKFHRSELLVEAVTHPSFGSAVCLTGSYQRLEFLGDGESSPRFYQLSFI